MVYQKRFESLHGVLEKAISQASEGKGHERHDYGERFEEQVICWLTRKGLNFTEGQAAKKIIEGARLRPGGAEGLRRAIYDQLGAINYIAANIIVMKEELARAEKETNILSVDALMGLKRRPKRKRRKKA